MLGGAVCYAAKALAHLAGCGQGSVLVREIADATDIPGPYLAKIVNALARKGFVATQRGVGGGVSLARDPESVTLHELCVALDDPIVETRCMLEDAGCSDDRACPAHDFWVAHRDKELEFLQRTTIQDMAAFEATEDTRTRDIAKGLGVVPGHGEKPS
jgi:Rrf2 family iron-sulfur cluster assembly transcriptional regulator